MRVVSLLAKGKSGKTSKSLKILWKLLQALKTKGCTAEFKNGLFHFLSMQRYGRRNFQKQIPPYPRWFNPQEKMIPKTNFHLFLFTSGSIASSQRMPTEINESGGIAKIRISVESLTVKHLL